MYKACVFDMDGTILNTLDSIAYFANKALVSAGLSNIPTERYKQLVGNGVKILLDRMLEEVDEPANSAKRGTVAESYENLYAADPYYLVRPYDGIAELLSKLKASGTKLAILSNKPDAPTGEIAARFFPETFDIVRGQREGVAIKPDPTALLSIIEELKVDKKDVLYIGDSGVDMQTAANAGLTSCGVLWGFRGKDELLESGAKHLANSANELEKIIYTSHL